MGKHCAVRAPYLPFHFLAQEADCSYSMDGLGEQRYLINSLIKKIKCVEEWKYEEKKIPLPMMDGLIIELCLCGVSRLH